MSDAKKFTTLAPSLRVGLSGLSYNVNAESGQLVSTMDLSLVFITKDNKVPNSRHTIALAFLLSVLLLVKDGSWGVENTYATDKKSVTARNYWGVELMETGLAMWLVSWKQDAILGQDAWLANNKYGL